MARRIIVGISGSSGVIYGVRLLQALRALGTHEVHLIVSAAADRTLAVETRYRAEDLRTLCEVYHRNDNLAASIASGSFITEGMIVIPCSIKTLSGIANSYADTLMVRAADVVLKERRKLVLMPRETPLHLGHCRLLLQAAEMGAIIAPPIPAFYGKPKTIDDLINHSVGRVLDLFDIDCDLIRRWQGARQR
jgi:4-hydroxy-3-polyprenylbenzoate decarboxylase